MRIAIDARLSYYVQAGITQYTLNLIRALADIDRENEYSSLQRRPDQRSIVDQENFRRVPLLAPPHHPLEQYVLGLELSLRSKQDVIHCTDFIPPFYYRGPTVVTIHDLIPLLLPEYRGGPLVRLYTALVARTARNAALALTDSQASRRDILAHLDLPDERVRVVYLAVDERYAPLPAADDADLAPQASYPYQPTRNSGEATPQCSNHPEPSDPASVYASSP